MNGELTDEAIEEGRLAILNLEKELKERANDSISVGSNKLHSSTTDERRILDQMPREARLSNRLESLGLTVEELDDRGLLDGGGSVPSYVTSLKNKSRRTLELQSRSHRLQGRDKETFTKLLNSFLHMIRTLVRKGLNLDIYCRRHDPNRRGLMRKKAFFTMLKTIGLPFTGRELQDITHHYMVPASDQADYVSLLKDARIVNLGAISTSVYDQEPDLQLQEVGDSPVEEAVNKSVDANAELERSDTGVSSPVNEPVKADMELSTHTLVLADVRRMLLASIRSLSKDQDDVYRMFARWDTNGTGTVTATQFLRVLARLHVDISDQDQDFLVELLDTNGMGRIDFEGLIAFCFASTPETDLLSPAGMLSGGGSVSVGDDNINETMSAVSTDGNTSVDQKSHNNGSSGGINSRRPRTATLSRPYNEYMSNAHAGVHNNSHPANAPLYAPQTYYQHHNVTLEEQHQRAVNSSRANNPRGIQRPLTASGRVSSTHENALSPTNPAAHGQHGGGRYFPSEGDGLGSGKYIKTQSLIMEYGHADRATGSHNDAVPMPKVKSTNNPLPRGPLSGQQSLHKQMSHGKLQQHRGPAEGEDSQYVVELPDDVMYGEEKYLSSDNARVRPLGLNKAAPSGELAAPKESRHAQEDNSRDNNSNNNNHYYDMMRDEGLPPPREDSPDMQDMGSFNDNTLVTDQDEYFFGSPKEIPNVNNTRNMMMNWSVQPQNNELEQSRDHSRHGRGRNEGESRVPAWRENDMSSNNNGGQNTSDNSMQAGGQYQPSFANHGNAFDGNDYNQNNTNLRHHNGHNGGGNSHNNTGQSSHTSYESAGPPTKEPIEHLVLLANQILSTLREIIMGRYRRGRSLQEIFEHFDRTEKTYFDARDFVVATADLRIETSPRVASIAINMIALDGYDKVSFGEFKVFVLDSDHKLLELNVQEQLAQMLEQKGREYQSFMVDMFWNEEESLNDSRVSATGRAYRQNEYVSKIAFVTSLQRIGLVLTSSELSRLVDRFDVFGNEMCSVLRFVRMVQNSRAWRHGEKVLAYQDEAIEEAEYLRQQLSSDHGTSLPDLPAELISMCEYLGIRVLSEPNMVWIAADALKAPLPVSWTAQKDANGRTYFYNHLNNQTKLEHPLDPHFRKLRDKYRQGGSNEADMDGSTGRSPTNNTNSAAAANKNSNISFGGVGAALNPPPLNQSLVGQARPSPPPNSFQHLYTHASAEHNTFPVINHPQANYQTASVQMMQDEDEVLYVKYGNGNMGNNAPPVKPGPSSGYGQPPRSNNPAPAAGRRPQSALDRTQYSSSQQQQQLPRAREAASKTAESSPQGQGQAPSQGQGTGTGSTREGQGLPSGFSTGIYTAELKALVGSAAYNRPMSAPQNHPIQAEKLAAYADATHRMRDPKEEPVKRNTMELLEQVYTTQPTKPVLRSRTANNSGGFNATANSSNANMNMNMNVNMNNINNTLGGSGNMHQGGMGPRTGSAKWSASPSSTTNTTPLSVVDRALSIGRTQNNSNSNYNSNNNGNDAYLPSQNYPNNHTLNNSNNAYNNTHNNANYNNYGNNYNNISNNNNANQSQPRERARSANRATRRNPPLDNHTKQARLSEMFDDAIIDKLDSAIGLHRR